MTKSVSLGAPSLLYGRKLGEALGLEAAPAIVTRTLGQAEIAVTDLQVRNPSGQLSAPLPRVDAYLISLTVSGVDRNYYWEDGREISSRPLLAGQMVISDARYEPRVLMDSAFHSVLFYLPRTAIDALTDQAGAPRIDDLRYEHGAGISDETVKHLSLSLMPAFNAPAQANRLFLDHVTLALASHTVQTYGGIRMNPKQIKGGLAPWQERLAKEVIANNLSGTISLNEIAKSCGLSIGHFSRAFRASTGLAPHAWLLHARVESAKLKLRHPNASLSEVALSCGFADRSHFTRVFTRLVGVSPRAWSNTIIG
ncbi:AraC family transcriptional regulator [Bradyrhizobium sp. S3.12.5]|uniref:helix-turn-helix transcriptional regulator n=1 Tax=Bradyrhizobium sp. S3.12.5 TaxID=3156386 RepID=UPI0033913551